MFTLEKAMKAQKGKRCIALLRHYTSTLVRGCVVNATTLPLYPGNDPVHIV
jgi:hypothetical protein